MHEGCPAPVSPSRRYAILGRALRHRAYAPNDQTGAYSTAFTAAHAVTRRTPSEESPMRRFTTIAGALLVLAGCTESETSIVGPGGARGTSALPTPADAGRNITSETSSDLWARIITGETGPGSSYQLY